MSRRRVRRSPAALAARGACTPLAERLAVWRGSQRSSQYREGDQQSPNPVDGAAERRPPAGPGNQLPAALPQILTPMSDHTTDQNPGRAVDAHRSEQHEDRGDATLDGDGEWPSATAKPIYIGAIRSSETA
jgi:hypothetical protein